VSRAIGWLEPDQGEADARRDYVGGRYGVSDAITAALRETFDRQLQSALEPVKAVAPRLPCDGCQARVRKWSVTPHGVLCAACTKAWVAALPIGDQREIRRRRMAHWRIRHNVRLATGHDDMSFAIPKLVERRKFVAEHFGLSQKRRLTMLRIWAERRAKSA
jgi:hypothetical protein